MHVERDMHFVLAGSITQLCETLLLLHTVYLALLFELREFIREEILKCVFKFFIVERFFFL